MRGIRSKNTPRSKPYFLKSQRLYANLRRLIMAQALGLKRRVTQLCLLQQEFSNLVITPLLGPQLGNRRRKRITLVLLGCIAGDDSL